MKSIIKRNRSAPTTITSFTQMCVGQLYSYTAKKGSTDEGQCGVILFSTVVGDTPDVGYSIIELHGKDAGKMWAFRDVDEFDELLAFYTITPFNDSLIISSK